jgi:hypothetical protein
MATKKITKKRPAKKVKPVVVEAPKLSWRDKLNVKVIVLQANLNVLKSRVVLAWQSLKAKLRGY